MGLLAPARAEAIDPIRDRWEHLDPRVGNEVAIEAMTLSNFAGLNLAYRRGLGRHLSVGALFEYTYPNPGYGHLVGFGHTLEVSGWIKRPWTGLFLATTFTVGHQFVVALPRLRSVALGAGVSLGWSWDLTDHVNVAVSGGLRRMAVVADDTQICTLPQQCIFTTPGFTPRFTLTFAYRF